MHCNGTNGSTTFIDSSSKGRTITANGNAQISTTSPKFGTGAYLGDGTGDYLAVPHDASDDFGTGNFTLECFVKFTTVSQKYIINRNTTNICDILMNSSTQVIGYVNGTPVVTASWTPSTATWYHVAWVRNGTRCDLYVDGTSLGNGVNSTSISDTAGWTIGALQNAAASLDGRIDEVRISNVARWTTNFTPPAAEYS